MDFESMPQLDILGIELSIESELLISNFMFDSLMNIANSIMYSFHNDIENIRFMHLYKFVKDLLIMLQRMRIRAGNITLESIKNNNYSVFSLNYLEEDIDRAIGSIGQIQLDDFGEDINYEIKMLIHSLEITKTSIITIGSYCFRLKTNFELSNS